MIEYEIMNEMYERASKSDCQPDLTLLDETAFVYLYGQEELDKGLEEGWIIRIGGTGLRIQTRKQSEARNKMVQKLFDEVFDKPVPLWTYLKEKE